ECARCGMTTQVPEDPAAEAVCAFCRSKAPLVKTLPIVEARAGGCHSGRGANAREAGEGVVLQDVKGRRYLITLEQGAPFHTHKGRLAHDQLIGSAEGGGARTALGQKLLG